MKDNCESTLTHMVDITIKDMCKSTLNHMIHIPILVFSKDHKIK